MPDGIGFSKQLHFLALVELAAIPLYLLAKPHLDVWTEDEEAELWLTNCLLSNLNDRQDAEESSAPIRSPWWSRPAQQSDLGILLEVRDEEPDSQSPGAVITEFLIYAAVLKSTDSPSYLPSPPASSSPLRINGSDESSHEIPVQNVQKIRIRAVPLTSTAHQVDCINCLNISPIDHHSNNNEAYFLPTISKTTSAVPNSPPKRQRILHMFEDAAHQRKQLRRRGGEGICRAMARLDSPGLCSDGQRGLKLADLNPNGPGHLNTQNGTGEKKSTRSSSTPLTSQIDPLWVNSMIPQNGIEIQSSLRGRESIGSLEQTPALATNMNSFENQNKSVLTRIIMAGMRIYGFQQRRKSVKLQADSELGTHSTLIDMNITRGDDEYKMVYHQTFKAATFTFRNRMSKGIINQATMGDVVDQLLALFCTDPLAAQDVMDSFTSSSDRKKGE